jgi:hypothetical protein
MVSYFDKVYAVARVNEDGTKTREGQFYSRKHDAEYRMSQRNWRGEVYEVLEFELTEGKVVATTCVFGLGD